MPGLTNFCHTIEAAPEPEFIPHPPPNYPGGIRPRRPIRVGNMVQVVFPFRVVRVGYRKQLSSYEREAIGILSHLAHSEEHYRVFRDAGLTPRNSIAVRAVAYHLAQKDSFGGPERGVHGLVNVRDAGFVGKVLGKKTYRLGTYYPPSGGGDDYDGGGLHSATSFVTVTISGRDWIEYPLSCVSLV